LTNTIPEIRLAYPELQKGKTQLGSVSASRKYTSFVIHPYSSTTMPSPLAGTSPVEGSPSGSTRIFALFYHRVETWRFEYILQEEMVLAAIILINVVLGKILSCCCVTED
jgi:hypothetical protein